MGDKVPSADKTKAEGLIKDLKEAIAAENDETIQSLLPELQQVLYSIGTSMYQQAGGPEGTGAAPGGGAGPTPGSSGGDDVIDAEFSE